MTHPWIEASLKYRQAQAKVLQDADAFEATGGKDAANLFDAVRKMREAKAAYTVEKTKAFSKTHE